MTIYARWRDPVPGFDLGVVILRLTSGNLTLLLTDPPLNMGKLTRSMAIFNSYVSHYQRVVLGGRECCCLQNHSNSRVLFQPCKQVNFLSVEGGTAPFLAF